ncbi:hypothetical protein AB833_29315 [Chromatiales bacterium (ex Bugula neritina AB1)]|nr:hypothetical protein AB833_29315 [Chromatiales bacterium (ex Bugula neritina AB1)]
MWLSATAADAVNAVAVPPTTAAPPEVASILTQVSELKNEVSATQIIEYIDQASPVSVKMLGANQQH